MDDDDEDEWESAADNFQVKVSIKENENFDDEWEGGTDGFFATSEIKNHLAGAQYLIWQAELHLSHGHSFIQHE
jgi:hypothetical protein